MELFWIFATVCLLCMLLLAAVRQGAISWGWNFLLIAIIMFFGLFKITGTPREALWFATIENMHGDLEVIAEVTAPHKFIYLLLRKQPGDQPYYVRLPWTQPIEQELDSALMTAKEQETTLLVDADRLSRWLLPPNVKLTGRGKDGKADKDGEGKAVDTGEAGQPQGKEGGEKMFYPKPVSPDPLKTPVHSQIEVH